MKKEFKLPHTKAVATRVTHEKYMELLREAQDRHMNICELLYCKLDESDGASEQDKGKEIEKLNWRIEFLKRTRQREKDKFLALLEEVSKEVRSITSSFIVIRYKDDLDEAKTTASEGRTNAKALLSRIEEEIQKRKRADNE